jgi:2-polyprenyl-3-methyl-5-hydroxy-6-metoxy-1,4-benzoquinol methylase
MKIIHRVTKPAVNVYFKTQLSELSQLPFYEFQRTATERSGNVLISSIPLEVKVEAQLTVFVSQTRKKQILGLILPTNLLDQVWQSKTTDALLIEIFCSNVRLGYDFVYREIPNISSVKLRDQFSGRWFSWRNFSKRTNTRVSGTADFGSVLADTLEVLGSSMPNYAKWLASKTSRHATEKILEIGAGTGTMTALYAATMDVVAVEPSDSARAILRANTNRLVNVVVTESLSEAKNYGPYNHAVLINVLEHVEHDVQLLREIKLLLNPGGTLTVLSPAHNMLYSKFDASIGHVRRYTRSTIKSTFQIAGYDNVESHYFNSLGAILWLIINRLLSMTSANSNQTSIYDRVIVPISAKIDDLGIRPFGQSVIATGNIK